MRSPAFPVCLVALLLSTSTEARETKKREPLAPGIAVEERLEHHGSYVNAMGEGVHAPSARVGGGVPDGATTKWGTLRSASPHSWSGTCSPHGGVGGD